MEGLGWGGGEGLRAKDRGGLGFAVGGGGLAAFGFFFLFEIEREEKEEEADGLVGGPLAEASEPGVLVKVICGVDADAVIADDPFEICFHEGGEFVIAYVHVQLHAG